MATIEVADQTTLSTINGRLPATAASSESVITVKNNIDTYLLNSSGEVKHKPIRVLAKDALYKPTAFYAASNNLPGGIYYKFFPTGIILLSNKFTIPSNNPDRCFGIIKDKNAYFLYPGDASVSAACYSIVFDAVGSIRILAICADSSNAAALLTEHPEYGQLHANLYEIL